MLKPICATRPTAVNTVGRTTGQDRVADREPHNTRCRSERPTGTFLDIGTALLRQNGKRGAEVKLLQMTQVESQALTIPVGCPVAEGESQFHQGASGRDIKLIS